MPRPFLPLSSSPAPLEAGFEYQAGAVGLLQTPTAAAVTQLTMANSSAAHRNLPSGSQPPISRCRSWSEGSCDPKNSTTITHVLADGLSTAPLFLSSGEVSWPRTASGSGLGMFVSSSQVSGSSHLGGGFLRADQWAFGTPAAPSGSSGSRECGERGGNSRRRRRSGGDMLEGAVQGGVHHPLMPGGAALSPCPQDRRDMGWDVEDQRGVSRRLAMSNVSPLRRESVLRFTWGKQGRVDGPAPVLEYQGQGVRRAAAAEGGVAPVPNGGLSRRGGDVWESDASERWSYLEKGGSDPYSFSSFSSSSMPIGTHSPPRSSVHPPPGGGTHTIAKRGELEVLAEQARNPISDVPPPPPTHPHGTAAASAAQGHVSSGDSRLEEVSLSLDGLPAEGSGVGNPPHPLVLESRSI